PLLLDADHAARLVLTDAMGRRRDGAALDPRARLRSCASRFPQRRDPRFPRQLDRAARRSRSLPRSAGPRADAPAGVGQPAALHLLHDLRSEDHAARSCRPAALRCDRRLRRLRAAAPLRPEPDRLGALLLRPARPRSRCFDLKRKEGDPPVRTAICGFVLALSAAHPAAAFCGFFVGKADSQLFNKSSQVAIVRDGEHTVITMGNDFSGEMNEFALVVPVPSVLSRDQIHVGERRLLERLDAYSAPRLVEYTDGDPCMIARWSVCPMAVAPATKVT